MHILQAIDGAKENQKPSCSLYGDRTALTISIGKMIQDLITPSACEHSSVILVRRVLAADCCFESVLLFIIAMSLLWQGKT